MTIFAYGQTSSGKTYTMFGKDWETTHKNKHLKQRTIISDLEDDEKYSGIIPRAIHRLFTKFT